MTPVCVSIVVGDKYDKVINLWNDVYHRELGWMPVTTRATLSEDPYHEASIYLLAEIEELAIGTIRLSSPIDGLLPVERNAGNQPLFANTERIELTRLMVRRDYRGNRIVGFESGVFDLLMRTALAYADKNGLEHTLMDVRVPDAPHSLVKKLEPFGFVGLGNQYPDPLGSQFPKCTTVARRHDIHSAV